ncbi:MAG: nucleotide sugar dehydrogenase [Chlamydiae bacterium]|nr:nucleotide sugar dehydrogenase [Chlamydiota bacterium]
MNNDKEIFTTLLKKIKEKKAIIGLLGLGVVGKALLRALRGSGYREIGFDINKEVVKKLNQKKTSLFSATSDFKKLKECDVICIEVPTLLDKNKKLDLSFLRKTTETIVKNMRKGQLIILESSVAPGITRNFMLKELQKSKAIFGKDFFISFSPERVDPGNLDYTFSQIPKLVSGLDEKSLILCDAFYSSFVKTVKVSTPEVAELCKILENTFRFVNINLINEFSEYAAKKGIDLLEVIKAASTKPFGFMPFYPSLGAGGPCIPIVPYFLLEDAKKIQVKLPILQEAMAFQEKRIKKVVDLAFKILKKNKKKRKNILIVGMGFKPGSCDITESISLKIWNRAEKKGAKIFYHDPVIPQINNRISMPLENKLLGKIDLIIIAQDHKEIDYDKILKAEKPIIDPKGVFKEKNDYIYRV